MLAPTGKHLSHLLSNISHLKVCCQVKTWKKSAPSLRRGVAGASEKADRHPPFSPRRQSTCHAVLVCLPEADVLRASRSFNPGPSLHHVARESSPLLPSSGLARRSMGGWEAKSDSLDYPIKSGNDRRGGCHPMAWPEEPGIRAERDTPHLRPEHIGSRRMREKTRPAAPLPAHRPETGTLRGVLSTLIRAGETSGPEE